MEIISWLALLASLSIPWSAVLYRTDVMSRKHRNRFSKTHKERTTWTRAHTEHLYANSSSKMTKRRQRAPVATFTV